MTLVARRRRHPLVVRGRLKVGRRELCCGPFRVASSTRISFAVPLQLLRVTACWWSRPVEVRAMQVETAEPEIIERVAALDVGKTEVMCCVRLPGPRSRR